MDCPNCEEERRVAAAARARANRLRLQRQKWRVDLGKWQRLTARLRRALNSPDIHAEVAATLRVVEEEGRRLNEVLRPRRGRNTRRKVD